MEHEINIIRFKFNSRNGILYDNSSLNILFLCVELVVVAKDGLQYLYILWKSLTY